MCFPHDMEVRLMLPGQNDGKPTWGNSGHAQTRLAHCLERELVRQAHGCIEICNAYRTRRQTANASHRISIE